MKASRRTDPQSSHKAEYDITRSGERTIQSDIVLEAIGQHPGKTSRELTAYCELDRYQIARRANDLFHDDKVKRVGVGADELRWYTLESPTEAPGAILKKDKQPGFETDSVKPTPMPTPLELKIASYTRLMNGYPDSCPEKENIRKQIDRLKHKGSE